MIYAKYTVVLKTLLDDPIIKAKIDAALSTYPIYESKIEHNLKPAFIPTRDEINTALLNHYKYREIGFETVGQFIDRLEITMNEIMPYYNELMFSADQDFNIIYNVDYVKELETQRDGTQNTDTTSQMSNTGSGTTNIESSGSDTSSTNTEMNDNSKNVHSATPQSELSITAANIDNVQYADDAEWKNNNSNSQASTNGSTQASSTASNETENNSTGSITGTNTSESNEYTRESTKGNYGAVSAQSLIDRYRDTIVNIKRKLIMDKDIQDLFMQIY